MNQEQKKMCDMLSRWIERDLATKAVLRVIENNQRAEYRIIPNKQDACPIKILVSNAGGYVVLIGESLQFESDDGYDDYRVMQILKAVSLGKVREIIWYRNNQIIKSSGLVETEPTPFERKRVRLSALICRAHKKIEKKYVAY